MAVRRQKRGHAHRSDSDEEHLESSGRLAPLEEREEFKRSDQGDAGRAAPDTIRVDNTSVKMPEHFAAEERDAASTFRLHPVVIAILVFMLAFIAFITWQITLMPPAPAK